jgi:hypothetical protein
MVVNFLYAVTFSAATTVACRERSSLMTPLDQRHIGDASAKVVVVGGGGVGDIPSPPARGQE